MPMNCMLPTAAGVITKSEKVQCAVFLHVAGPDAQKVAHSQDIDSNDKDKINPLIEAFRNYCEGKDNITVSDSICVIKQVSQLRRLLER